MAKYKVGYFPNECMIITEIKRPEAVGVGVLMFKPYDEIELSDKEYTYIMEHKLINGALLKKVGVNPAPTPVPTPTPAPTPSPAPVEEPKDGAEDGKDNPKSAKPRQK